MPKKSPSARSGSTPSKPPVRRGRPKTAVTVEGDPLPPSIVSISEAAEILGYDRGALYDWFRNGCPKHEKGVIISEIVSWREARAAANAARRSDNLDQEKVELEIARTKLESAQIDLALKRKQLVAVSDVEFFVQDAFAAIRSGMLIIPSMIATPLSVETDPVECERLLRKTISKALDSVVSRKFEPA